jgi:RNA polymerase-interacting CarD/CdnL/TRCF family regulator
MNVPITAVLGPPPANVDLKQNRTWRDNAAVITISGIAVIAVVIRFIVRFRSQRARPVLDEWLIAVTLVSHSDSIVITATEKAHPLFRSRCWPFWLLH